MLKQRIVVILLMLSSFVLFAQEDNIEETKNRTGIEIEGYFSNRFALGDLNKVSIGNVGVGLSLEWTFPFLPIMGLSGRCEWEYVLKRLDRINSWQDITFMGGVFLNIPINNFAIFRPEISYGGVLNLATVEGVNVHYLDQIVQITPSFRFSNENFKSKGVTFELAPLYAFFTQRGDAAHYLGIRAGISYEF